VGGEASEKKYVPANGVRLKKTSIWPRGINVAGPKERPCRAAGEKKTHRNRRERAPAQYEEPEERKMDCFSNKREKKGVLLLAI